MKRKPAGLILALLLSVAPLRAEEAANTEIQGVIQSQIEAFLAKDEGLAFSFATPMIKGMFGSPAVFGDMVRRGYPMIWAPSDVEYLGLRAEGGRTLQRVLVRDADGSIFLFDYEMVAMPEGWRINGVFPVSDSGVGA